MAEDKDANSLTIRDYLETHGYEIVVARDGLEAVQKAQLIHPKLILMDIQMPVMDGLQAIRNIRADLHFTTTPIIVLTALAMPGDQARCLQAGTSDYMSKLGQFETII
ncbi:MAG TPA: response regulator [Anaerolineales bacterium]|nr:response regulator [Anaerolineales bacterium]